MTVTGSLASPVANPLGEARSSRASGSEISFRKTVRGQVIAETADSATPTESRRPTSARRAALMSTHAGREMAEQSRKDLSEALVAHKLAHVAALRLDAGMSQKELCARTGIPQPHLSRLENGRVATPELPTLQALASGLGVSLDVLIAAFVADTRAKA